MKDLVLTSACVPSTWEFRGSDRRHKNPHVAQINVCFMTTPTHACNFRADVQDVVVEAAPASR